MIVNEVQLDKARFGRRRFLAGVGGTLTVAAGALWFSERASASNCPLPGCFGYDMCPSCSGTQCVSSGCTAGVFGCPTGTQCWHACPNNGPNEYTCCDWNLPGFVSTCQGVNNRCICRGFIGSC